METLAKFNVGVGSERFRQEETGNLKLYDAVYFPLYALNKHPQAHAMATELAEPVRFKVRAVGKENKSK